MIILDRAKLKRMLLQNDCSLTLTALDLGCSVQRVGQIMKGLGLKIDKTVEECEPTNKIHLTSKLRDK